jgi:phage protein D
LYSNKSLYAILEEAIMRTDVATNRKHFIRDEFGTLQFTEIRRYVTDLIIGEKSLLNRYNFEKSIDRDTYNFVKLAQLNKESGRLVPWVVQDSNNVYKWGKLQHLVNVDETFSQAEMIKLGEDILSLKNRETQTMRLSALRIPELTAGTGFTLHVDKLNIRQQMWIDVATHTINAIGGKSNTMDLVVTLA